jgi:alpha-beta hydrolase superfamily lysophospholipase
VTLHDFTAEQAGEVATLDDYLRLEDRLFAELRQRIYSATDGGDASPFNRYSSGSRADPARLPTDWNRSFHRLPAPGTASRGAALLLHGLTDSPYSLRSIADHLAAQGFEVFALRLPGHGTAPSGLLTFQIEDMQAAVRLAMRDLRRRGAPDRPIYLVGYSNGGALAVDYTLAVLDGEPLPKPAGLVLVSPAIGVSRLAIVGRVKTGLSSVPGFERAAWETLQLEFDPFKYTSFSFHAAGETFRLTRRVANSLERLAADGAIEGFPPMLVFLSTVDSTVHADAVTEVLLDRLAPRGHELVLFDVNRYSAVQSLLVRDPGPLTKSLLAKPRRPYGLTVITNGAPDTLQVQELRARAGTSEPATRPLALEWPANVFSVSHVALTFPPDDPLYGYAAPADADHVQLGRIEIHGENGVLKVPMWALTRQRSNPFHAYLLERLDEFVAAGTAAR